MSPSGHSRVPPRAPGRPAEVPIVQAKKVAPPEVHWPQRLRAAQAKLPTVAPPLPPQQKTVAPPPVYFPRKPATSTALQPRTAPGQRSNPPAKVRGLVLQPATKKKEKPKKMTLAELQQWAESQKKATSAPPEKKAWSAVVAASAAAPVVAVAAPVKPTSFGGDCAPEGWSNARIAELVALAARPARFWASNLTDRGGTDETYYWSFDALWVLSGDVSTAGRLSGGTYVEGTLQLHYHPHAKSTDNYLHIKKSDGSDPGAGAFKNNHWLVAAIGLTAAALTPDGT